MMTLTLRPAFLSLEDNCAEARRIAALLGVSVEFEFNGVEVNVTAAVREQDIAMVFLLARQTGRNVIFV